MNNIIELRNITKQFGASLILQNMDLSIKRNEFVTLLGPSGCGKTTTLRIIGGFEAPDSGDLLFEGKRINNIPPHKRKVNTVFQKYALFPHLDVSGNIAFGLKILKTDETIIRDKVNEMLQLVGLSGFEKRKISSLSGGQQQRVAIARALVNEPDVLLLDEPLGALDLKLRQEMQMELKKMQRKLGITFIYVTHDQEEALTMSDKIVVMSHGLIQQQGTPTDIYNEPVNAFVANFIGESNIVDSVMKRDKVVEFHGYTFNCVDAGFEPDEQTQAVIRPEDIVLTPVEEGYLTGVVQDVVFKGVHYEIRVNGDFDHYLWKIHSTRSAKPGARIGMQIGPDEIHIMRAAASF